MWTDRCFIINCIIVIVSVFILPYTDKEEQVELSDLIGSLSKSSEHGKLKKKLVSRILQ